MVFCNNTSSENCFILYKGHNPYFNRWFSAIKYGWAEIVSLGGHNPYFNRWFSAIKKPRGQITCDDVSQSLF